MFPHVIRMPAHLPGDSEGCLFGPVACLALSLLSAFGAWGVCWLVGDAARPRPRPRACPVLPAPISALPLRPAHAAFAAGPEAPRAPPLLPARPARPAPSAQRRSAAHATLLPGGPMPGARRPRNSLRSLRALHRRMHRPPAGRQPPPPTAGCADPPARCLLGLRKSPARARTRPAAADPVSDRLQERLRPTRPAQAPAQALP